MYDKEPLSCNGHSDENIPVFIKNHLMELLFILNKYLICLLSCKAVKNHAKYKKKSQFLENLRFF